MIKPLHRLIDIINGKITGRDPKLVRRLREGLNVSEIKKIKDGLFERGDGGGWFPKKSWEPYYGVECGEPSSVNYKIITNDYGVEFEDLTYKEKRKAITKDLITRIFHNCFLNGIRDYIILDDKKIDEQLREVIYQGVALTRPFSEEDNLRVDRCVFNLYKFQLEEVQYS